jgi:hypothetical protein
VQAAGCQRVRDIKGDVTVTYFDAALAWRRIARLATGVGFILVGALLAGCETGGSLFGGSLLAANETPPAEQAQPPQTPVARIALAPVIGAPDQVSKELSSQLTAALEKQRVSVAPDREAKADYMLRGYIVAARDKSSIKVSYIWDVTDPSGKRVNRVTGEEVLAAVNPKDPWASVTPAVTQAIADKTGASLGTWISSQGAAVASGTGSTSGPAAVGAPRNQARVQSASGTNDGGARTASAPATSSATTASIGRSDELVAVVPPVTGAPGDGNNALATALQGELQRNGVAMSDRPGSYKVEGKVTMSQPKDGKQAIQIDWRVRDPQGKSLGTVSQKNEIPQGSLDGTWGKTADAAASAAAQGIIKLLPQPKSTN